MDILATIPGSVLIGSVALVGLLLGALELLIIRRISTLASPAIEFARMQANKEAEHILESARESARALVARAEAAAAELAATRAHEDEATRKAHEEALHGIQAQFETSLAAVAHTMQEAAEGARASLADELKTLGESARKEFATAVEASAKTFTAELAESLQQARAEAARYETMRKEAVDAHIRELVAETTKLALAEALPEAVHAKLIVKALEEAKATHVI